MSIVACIGFSGPSADANGPVGPMVVACGWMLASQPCRGESTDAPVAWGARSAAFLAKSRNAS